MADRGRPKNLTTVLRSARALECMRSKDRENIATLLTALADIHVVTFEDLWERFPLLADYP